MKRNSGKDDSPLFQHSNLYHDLLPLVSGEEKQEEFTLQLDSLVFDRARAAKEALPGPQVSWNQDRKASGTSLTCI